MGVNLDLSKFTRPLDWDRVCRRIGYYMYHSYFTQDLARLSLSRVIYARQRKCFINSIRAKPPILLGYKRRMMKFLPRSTLLSFHWAW